MNGIKRLRNLAKTEMGFGFTGAHNVLTSIADQIERELREALGATVSRHECDTVADVSMSAYDLLPQEDRDAIAWVREHGGLSHVKEHWSGRVAQSHVHNMAERHKAKIARMQSHIEFVQGKCRERQERIVELNKTIAAMRPRLVPEGGWPRFEDGEMVLIGSDFADWLGETHTVTSIEFFEDGVSLRWNPDEPEEFAWLSSDERVKRPAPKVLDADWVEIRVGDTVYEVEGTDHAYKVVGVRVGDGDPLTPTVVTCDEGDGTSEHFMPLQITHRAPVLAADGKPLEVGQTVWDKDSGDRLIVGAIEDGGHTVTCRYADLGDSAIPTHGSWSPCNLTHELPDSWERLEADAEKRACDYFGGSPAKGCEGCKRHGMEGNCIIEKSRDIVRRAKALSERDA